MNVTTQEAKSTGRWLTLRRAIAAAFTAALTVTGLLPLLGASAASAATSITGLTGPAAAPATAGGTSTYTFNFTTSATGALTAGTGTIAFAGPAGTTFPATASSYTVNVNGGGAVASPTVAISNGGATATVTTPSAVGNSTPVVVVIAGVTNPASGTYSIGVSTTADASVVTTSSYTIASAVTAVTGPSASTSAKGGTATYSLGFKTSASGALTGGSSTITIQAPAALPTTMGNYFVNGDAITAAPTMATFAGNANAQATITVPAALSVIAASTSVSIVIESVTNVNVAGNYTIGVSTSSDTSPAQSPSFTIGTQVTAVGLAGISTTAIAATGVIWPVTFTAFTALVAGTDTISVIAPAGTTLPTTASSYVVSEATNTTSAAATAVNVSGTTATLTVPTGVVIAAGDNTTITINGVTNPSTIAPANVIAVATSKDTAPGVGTFATQTAVTGATVSATNTGASTATLTITSNYTITFTATTAVAAAQFVYVCAPSAANQYVAPNALSTTAANYSIAAGGGIPVAIAAAAAQAGGAGNPCPAGTTGVKLTVPATLNNGLGILTGQSVSVVLAGQNNPVSTTNYMWTVTTTGDPAYASSNSFAIGAQPSNTVFNVGVTPDSPGANEYLIGFQTPAAIPAAGTISVTFPRGTVEPTLGNWKIGSGATPAAAVAAEAACAGAGTTCTALALSGTGNLIATFTVGATNPAAGNYVAIQQSAVSTGADPAAGNYVVQVKTSVDTNNASSNYYVIGTPTCPPNGAGCTLGQPTVVPSPATANAPEQMTVANTASSVGALSGTCATFCQGNTITLTSTSADVANPFQTTAADYLLNGIQVTTAATLAGAGGAWTAQVTLPAAFSVGAGIGFTVAVAGYNEATAGTYTISEKDSPQPGATSSASMTLAATATKVTGVTGPAPNPNTAGKTSLYTLGFTTTATGAMAPGSSTITVVVPSGTALPTTASSYTVANIAASTVVLSNNNTKAVITVPASVPPASVGNSTAVSVAINGVTNPVTPSTTGTISLWTSNDPLAATTGTYAIAAGVGAVAGLAPDAPSAGGGATRVYTASFTTSAFGAMDRAVAVGSCVAPAAPTGAAIAITGASGTLFTGVAGDYVVNGVAAATATAAAVGGSATANLVCLTLNNTGVTTIPASSMVMVSVNHVTNPGSANSGLTWTVVTGGDASPVTGPAYAISTTLTINGAVTLSNNVAQQPGNYTVNFTPATALTGGTDTITVVFPSGTVLSTSASNYLVNNIVAASAAVTGTQVVIALATGDSLSAGTAYNVVANNATNPNPGSSYAIVMSTTKDMTPVASANYTIIAPPAPTVTTINPATGATAGGTSVVITGTNFTSSATVNFGAIPATKVTFTSGTSLTAVSPSQAANTVDVTVATIGGTSAVSAADKYVYTAPVPTVTAVSPTSGTTAGGTAVTITGTGLTAATAVKFGSTASTSFTVNSDTSIVATSPAEAAGAVDVTVTTAGGTSATSSGDKFTYSVCTAAPTVTGIAPTSGPAAGGTVVTITGTGFEVAGTPATCVATSVMFGTVAGTSVTVNSATQITATSPAGSAGSKVDVTVTGPGGTSATSSADMFMYAATVTQGYYLVGTNGKVYPYGSAQSFGDAGNLHLVQPIISMRSTCDGMGYWLLSEDGGVFSFGDAGFFGSMGGKSLNAPIVAIAPTADCKGYWFVGSDGGMFAFGDAGYFGSTYQINPAKPAGGSNAVTLNKQIVGLVGTPDGQGYWMVAEDGGIFAFGDAGFVGSMGGKPLNAPVIGMIPSVTGRGYLMIASDGGTFAFGDAGFFGSPVGHLTTPNSVVGIAITSDGQGYWVAGKDASVYAFGNASGTLTGNPPASPASGVIDIAAP